MRSPLFHEIFDRRRKDNIKTDLKETEYEGDKEIQQGPEFWAVVCSCECDNNITVRVEWFHLG
jgi:hypothetical protein